MRAITKNRKGSFCDEGYLERLKERKRNEYLDRGEPIPRWLLIEPKAGEQTKIDFTEGTSDGNGSHNTH